MLLLAALLGCAAMPVHLDAPIEPQPGAPQPTKPRRLNVFSGWYPVADEDVNLFIDYCGWDVTANRQIANLTVHAETRRMMAHADDLILFCFFLFDNLYVPQPPPWDLVEDYTQLLLERKQSDPNLTIVMELDLFHKAWGQRKSEKIERLSAAGVDVFYSDVLETKSAYRWPFYEGANELGRWLDKFTFGLLGSALDAAGSLPVPVPGARFDGEQVSLNTIGNAAYLKANHRKVLVTRHDGQFEALVTSWNPHNASLLHENHALTVRGPLAAYIYMVLREDAIKSAKLKRSYVQWSNPSKAYRKSFFDKVLPELPLSAYHAPHREQTPGDLRASFATEQAVEKQILHDLRAVEAGDEVRIQMFYLSRPEVIHAILDAAKRTEKPVCILLDPNRVGINYEKNGTPNSQVAAYMMQRKQMEKLNLEIRWYATRGEQNHAKAMSISNPATGKYQLTVGSSNWTRKNLAGINLEGNLFVEGSARLNRQFDEAFDRFWYNRDPGIIYSAAWDDPDLRYHRHAGMWRWADRVKFLWVFPLNDKTGRPRWREQEFVHW